MNSKNISLTPDFQLLNPEFDGYKLQTREFLNTLCRRVENDIFKIASNNTLYLFTRLESLNNYLIYDPFDIYHVYTFNSKGNLLLFKHQEECLTSGSIVWEEELETPVGTGLDVIKKALPPSVSFPSSNFAVSTNGFGNLRVLETGDRNNGIPWINVFEMSVNPGVILQSLIVESSEENKLHSIGLHILLLSILSPEDLTNDNSNYIPEGFIRPNVSALHVLYWYYLKFDGDKWQLNRERRIAGHKSLCYSSISCKEDFLVLIGHDHYEFIYDSQIPIEKPSKDNKANLDIKLKYIFKQSNDEIAIFCQLGKGTQKANLSITVDQQAIEIKHKDFIILKRNFLHPVEKCAITWTLKKDKVEINLPKVTENLNWEKLFEEANDDVEEIMDESLVAEIHQRLAHLTSDEWEVESEDDRPPFNPGQLESCDDAADDLHIMTFDGSSHQITHLGQLGSVQHLFNVQVEGDSLPSFCLRHDVDGLIWSLKDDASIEHTATFNAFGYVKASKATAKFTRAAPDNSYVAIADVNSRVFVFYQPENLGSELRNRKSGHRTKTVARQLVISLKNHDQIMGFHCTPNVIFVLTIKELYAYTLKDL